jgi:hypothetical protein
VCCIWICFCFLYNIFSCRVIAFHLFGTTAIFHLHHIVKNISFLFLIKLIKMCTHITPSLEDIRTRM